MRRRLDLTTPADVFFDPVVQLAALCPICALAALRPEAALAALAPGLVLFNPAINPAAALAAFAAGSVPARRRPHRTGRPAVGPGRPWLHDAGVAWEGDQVAAGAGFPAGAGGGSGAWCAFPGAPDAVVVRPGGSRWVFRGDGRA